MGKIKGTLSDAIASVSTMNIIEYFDIPYKINRGKTYILCPGHDDKHFGSCYVDKDDNGYYCYACSKHVTKWEMLLQLNGGERLNACRWFFDQAHMTPLNVVTNNSQNTKVYSIINIIRAYIDNSVVYNDQYTCDRVDSTYGNIVDNDYLYSTIAISNPLFELYTCDKELFKQIVITSLKSHISKTISIKTKYQKEGEALCVEGKLIAGNELAQAAEINIRYLKTLIREVEAL